MNELVNSALLAHYSKAGSLKPKKSTKRQGVCRHSYDKMSDLERRELHQMLSELLATPSQPSRKSQMERITNTIATSKQR